MPGIFVAVSGDQNCQQHQASPNPGIPSHCATWPYLWCLNRENPKNSPKPFHNTSFSSKISSQNRPKHWHNTTFSQPLGHVQLFGLWSRSCFASVESIHFQSSKQKNNEREKEQKMWTVERLDMVKLWEKKEKPAIRHRHRELIGHLQVGKSESMIPWHRTW